MGVWGNVSDFGLCKKCLTRRVSEISLPPVTQLTRQTPAHTDVVVNDALALLGLVLVILLGLVLIAGGGPPLL